MHPAAPAAGPAPGARPRRLSGARRALFLLAETGYLPACLLGWDAMGQHCTSGPCLQGKALPSWQGREKDRFQPLGFFVAKDPVWERPPLQFILCHGFSGVGSAGTGTESPSARMQTPCKGSDPTPNTLSAITRPKTAAAI